MASSDLQVEFENDCRYRFRNDHVLECAKMWVRVPDVTLIGRDATDYLVGAISFYERRGITVERISSVDMSIGDEAVSAQRFSAIISGKLRHILAGALPDNGALRPFVCRVAPNADPQSCGDAVSSLVKAIQEMAETPQLYLDGEEVTPNQECVGIGKRAVRCGQSDLAFVEFPTELSSQKAVSTHAAKTIKWAADRTLEIEPVDCAFAGKSVPCTSVLDSDRRLLIFGRVAGGKFNGALCDVPRSSATCLGIVDFDLPRGAFLPPARRPRN